MISLRTAVDFLIASVSLSMALTLGWQKAEPEDQEAGCQRQTGGTTPPSANELDQNAIQAVELIRDDTMPSNPQRMLPLRARRPKPATSRWFG